MAEATDPGYFTPPNAPDPLAEKRNKKKSKGLLITAAVILIVFGLLGAGAYVLWQRMGQQEPESDAIPSELPSLGTTNEITTSASEEDVEEAPFGSARFTSENFRIGDVAIAGEAEFILTEDTIEPLVVSAVRGDAFAEKGGASVNVIVSWRTNKLAKSEITYSKGAGQPEKVVREAQYGLTHSLIIPKLEPGVTYTYAIRAQDRFGNTATSDAHAVYTGSREASLFDLISDAIADIFGWALK